MAASTAISALVIDDNPGDRGLVAQALADASRAAGTTCGVVGAGSLGTGLELLRKGAHRFDAILLDLGLPDTRGLDGLVSLRSVNSGAPIIILTGHADLLTATEALKHGASDYLHKDELQSATLWRAISYSIERKKFESELVEYANTDPLTGVLNRRAFFAALSEALEQARRSELHCAVIVFDIDGFKEINDRHGHHVGDALLTTIAEEVTARLRKTDTVGRLGGDEFAIVAPNIKAAGGAFQIAEKVAEAVRSIDFVDGIAIRPSISIGIAVFPLDDNPANVLVAHADMAMYKSKSKKTGPIHYYDQQMDRSIKRRDVMRKRMLSDIPGRFYLDYQPIVLSRSNEVAGVEALARWQGPGDKVLPPNTFIPIAEESGWMPLLGGRLLEQVCTQIRQSIEEGLPVVPVSLNVSAAQCGDQTFAARMIGTIRYWSVDPALINIEITEEKIRQNLAVSRYNLHQLKDAGIGVHIDDFGTGYFSFAILKDLPLDVIKIDKTFVAAMKADARSVQIVKAIVDLARRLEVKTVAEGVETEEQAAMLRAIGVELLQGFYFSRPVSIDKLRGLLADGAQLTAGTPARRRAAN